MNRQTCQHPAAPWRVGRQVGCTIYDAAGTLLGVMATPELAQLVVSSVNYSAQVWPEEFVTAGRAALEDSE